MRVLIDARYLAAEYSGIGMFSRNLLTALGQQDHANEYLVVVHSSFKGNLDLPDNFEIISEAARPVSVRTMTTLGFSLNRLGGDVLHSLFPLVPVSWRKPFVTTVYDLQPLLDPQFTALRPRPQQLLYDMFYRMAYPLSIRRAEYVMCASYATKNDVRQMFDDASDRTFVVHAAVTSDAYEAPSDAQIERVREKYNLPHRYIFYLGSTRPNKNLERMVDAFDEFLKQHPEHEDLHLVLVLKQDRFFDPLFARIRERGLLRRIQIHEQVPQADKKVFYHESQCLYFVTKYEGFGLPVLEAQALGIPVLTSTHKSLPEVAGKAAVLVNPDSTEEIVQGLARIVGDESLRAELRTRGPLNARTFSWDESAKEVLDMYTHLLA